LFGKFLGCKYFYRATFESCGLEIGHLAAVFLICAMLPQAIPAPEVTVLNPGDLFGKVKTCSSQKRYGRVIE
jgi:hypothetical protein